MVVIDRGSPCSTITIKDLKSPLEGFGTSYVQKIHLPRGIQLVLSSSNSLYCAVRKALLLLTCKNARGSRS
jgi:hypothetical protein